MFNANDRTTVVIPINDSHLSINSNYFGDLSKERLQIKDNTVIFKGDGNYRSKIGIPRKIRSLFSEVLIRRIVFCLSFSLILKMKVHT